MEHENPFISIVTPTRGNINDYWLSELLKVRGNVEFILVYPPKIPSRTVTDPRVRVIESRWWGEVMQRATGLSFARGEYVLALDDDDFVHPEIAELTKIYFNRFPESWLLRLWKAGIPYDKILISGHKWSPIPDMSKLVVCREGNPRPDVDVSRLIPEVPIAPLHNRFDIRCLILPYIYQRMDHKGWHTENFVDRVWRNNRVQPALSDFFRSTQIFGPLKWIPPRFSFGFDRVMALFVQARFFEKNIAIGHWMPRHSPQIIKSSKPNEIKPARFHFFSHILLVKQFPQYGYFWNLLLGTLYDVPRKIGKAIKMKLLGI